MNRLRFFHFEPFLQYFLPIFTYFSKHQKAVQKYMSNDILKHESDVWKTADLLRGSGIKESDFPKCMMPFYAVLMVESRFIRKAQELEELYGKENLEDFVELFKLEELGYNDFVIRHGITLKKLCENDKSFDLNLHNYLKAFDPETRNLLGVGKGTEDVKHLDISGICGQLKKKGILFQTVQTWSEIDLVPYDNSEITTLEEHIKRKWADMSAETAGEQYTPDDIIALIAEIIVSKLEDNGRFLTIYDPTCGGGNLLFGVEDLIMEQFERPTKTIGQDWNDALYALAKIESRFREDSEIKYGNSLTTISFIEKRFNIIVANPPYGVDWKGYKKDIQNDNTERFVALPSISDGQLLFTQHILYHLSNKEGLAVVVHNGSTLFSGDAGSGESNIRKYLFDQDWVEAIIQMPTDEFFNTGIYTYLWVFNKNKPKDRTDKVLLINGSELYTQLKKSRGKKRKRMNPPERAKIVAALTDFQNSDFARVFDKWEFYYNKQSIRLTHIDENGKAIEMPIKVNRAGETVFAKSIKLSPTKITQSIEDKAISIDNFQITEFDSNRYRNLRHYFDESLKPLIAQLDYKEAHLKIHTTDATYHYNADQESILETTSNGQTTALGCGKIVVKAGYKKATKTKSASIHITAELTQDLQKDYEIISYHPDKATNHQQIADFMAKYIHKPFDYLDNVVGVEINFNKVFYQAEQLRSVTEIVADLKDLEKQLEMLEKDLAL